MASTIQVRLNDDLKTRSDILFKKLGTSKKHADQGYIRDADDMIKDMRNKYGL